MRSFLVVSTDSDTISSISSALGSGCQVQGVSGMDHALEILRNKRYDLVFVDLRTLKEASNVTHYGKAFQPLKQLYPTIEIVVMASNETTRQAVMAVKAGADDYVTIPIQPDEIEWVVNSIYENKWFQSQTDFKCG